MDLRAEQTERQRPVLVQSPGMGWLALVPLNVEYNPRAAMQAALCAVFGIGPCQRACLASQPCIQYARPSTLRVLRNSERDLCPELPRSNLQLIGLLLKATTVLSSQCRLQLTPDTDSISGTPGHLETIL